MDVVLIYILYVITTSYLVVSLLDYLLRCRLGAVQGLIFGTIYFLLVPVGVLLISGKIPLPKEFSATTLTGITLAEYSREVLLTILLVFSLAVTDIFLRILVALNKEDRKNAVVLFSSAFDYRALLKVALLVYLATDAYYFYGSGLLSGGHWYTSRLDFIEKSGTIGVLVTQFIFISRILVLCALSSLYMKKDIRFPSYIGLLSLLSVVDIYTTGNRIFTFQSMSLVFFILFLKRNVRYIFALSVAAVPFGIFMNLFRYIRPLMHSELSFSALAKGYEFATTYREVRGITVFILGITESVNLNVLLDVLRLFPERVPFFWGETFAKLFVAFIPRSLWFDKPESITVQIAKIFVPTNTDTSLASTMYGEMYANFGYFSFMLIPLLVFFIIWITRLVIYDRGLRSLVGFIYGITFVRMAFSDVMLALILTGFFLVSITSIRHLKGLHLRYHARADIRSKIL